MSPAWTSVSLQYLLRLKRLGASAAQPHSKGPETWSRHGRYQPRHWPTSNFVWRALAIPDGAWLQIMSLAVSHMSPIRGLAGSTWTQPVSMGASSLSASNSRPTTSIVFNHVLRHSRLQSLPAQSASTSTQLISAETALPPPGRVFWRLWPLCRRYLSATVTSSPGLHQLHRACENALFWPTRSAGGLTHTLFSSILPSGNPSLPSAPPCSAMQWSPGPRTSRDCVPA
jgi:hypothetical protein